MILFWLANLYIFEALKLKNHQMKEYFKRSGLVFIIAGVVTLAISEFSKVESNKMLIISGGLIVFGLIVYVILNNILD